MAKKYIPSGYQIISIDVSDKTNGTPFTPETEDEKLLYEILSSDKIKKPILLDFKTSGYHFIGFPNIEIGSKQLILTYGPVGSTVTEIMSASSDTLEWEEVAE